MPDLLHDSPIRSDFLNGTLNGYQDAAQATSIYPGKGTILGLMYCTIKGSGEVGEFSEKVGKLLRDDGVQADAPTLEALSETKRHELARELGDELWYLAAKARELGYTLDQVARLNIDKLLDRQRRGTLAGSGDNR